MLVRQLNGEIANVYDYVGEAMILRGEAERIDGVKATVAIETATVEPTTEQAVLKYERTPKSRSEEVSKWLESLYRRNPKQSQ